MAFILSKAASGFRAHSHSQHEQKMGYQSHRQFHIQEPGARERAIHIFLLGFMQDVSVTTDAVHNLLKEDPVLNQFKTTKRSVKGYIRLGYALTFVVIAGCCHQIYVKAVMRKEALKQAQATK